MPAHLHILTTGGTIDKVYFDAKSAFEVGTPLVADILEAAGVGFAYEVEVLFQKDSLEITEEERRFIGRRVRDCGARCVLVTHGTDTMADTARVVSDVLGPDSDTTVVFVGSLTPARFKASDAEFNVGFAVAAAQTLPPGVYVAMNGQAFSAGTVRKNREQNRFEPVSEPITPA